jgi:hypothetical protein
MDGRKRRERVATAIAAVLRGYLKSPFFKRGVPMDIRNRREMVATARST